MGTCPQTFGDIVDVHRDVHRDIVDVHRDVPKRIKVKSRGYKPRDFL